MQVITKFNVGATVFYISDFGKLARDKVQSILIKHSRDKLGKAETVVVYLLEETQRLNPVIEGLGGSYFEADLYGTLGEIKDQFIGQLNALELQISSVFSADYNEAKNTHSANKGLTYGLSSLNDANLHPVEVPSEINLTVGDIGQRPNLNTNRPV